MRKPPPQSTRNTKNSGTCAMMKMPHFIQTRNNPSRILLCKQAELEITNEKFSRFDSYSACINAYVVLAKTRLPIRLQSYMWWTSRKHNARRSYASNIVWNAIWNYIKIYRGSWTQYIKFTTLVKILKRLKLAIPMGKNQLGLMSITIHQKSTKIWLWECRLGNKKPG